MNDALLILILLAIVCLVYFGATYTIGSMRVKKNASRQVKKYRLSHDKFKSILDHSYRIQDDSNEQLSPEHTKDVLRKLEKSTDENDNLLGRMLTKLQYVQPSASMKSMLITYFIVTAVVAFAVISFMGTQNILAIIAFCFPTTLFFYNVYVNYIYGKKIKRFLDNFIYALDIISRGVRSGLMLNDCFQLIANETDPSVSEQFQMILHDLRVGMSLEQVMTRFSIRINIKEVRFFAIVISIQSKTGGNLSEVIDNLATILRQRKTVLLRIQTLSQEAKSSAAILMSLPILIIILLSFVGGDYMDPLLYTTQGNMILGGAAFWMMCGVLIIRKMINFYR